MIIYFNKLNNEIDDYLFRSKNININKYICFKIIDDIYLTYNFNECTSIVKVEKNFFYIKYKNNIFIRIINFESQFSN